jgi:hypothetical protein
MADAPLARSYRAARAAFLAAADQASATVRSFAHPRTGIEGEDLFVDVAEIGPADATDVIVVVSGTHGVEGYLGSALQRRHLAARAEAPAGVGADGPAIVFIHALNPYGFSWVRRVNEDNVDVNRNFIDWSQPPPAAPGYAELAATLVPEDWTAETQERTLVELAGHLESLGLERLQQIVSGGQYLDPTGVFYGGSGPVWSNRWLRGFLAERLAGVRRAAVIDLHTGLGPWGHGELISSERHGSAGRTRQSVWWGDVRSMYDGTSVSAALEGDWLTAVPDFSPATEITSIAIEYGTVDSVTVLQCLRADAVLHAHGDPTAPEAAAVRDQVRAAFLDDDPAWLAACAARYDEVVAQAITQLT